MSHVDRLLISHANGTVDARKARRKISRDPIQSYSFRERVVSVFSKVSLPLFDSKGNAVLYFVVQRTPGWIDQHNSNLAVIVVVDTLFFQIRGYSRNVNVKVRQVFELVYEDSGYPKLVPSQLCRLSTQVHVMLWVRNRCGRNLVYNGTQRPQYSLFFDGLVVWQDYQACVSSSCAQRGQGYTGRSGGALDDETAGARPFEGLENHGFQSVLCSRSRYVCCVVGMFCRCAGSVAMRGT
ncbi:unnamed protein product [Pseudo-nitzschia multistriata]|uniref:Uncharacterized protein n=1 Tax=Pseudo-nitzschia multistriata TaxID=183589 RepID=A0A448ZGV0_9STRA|nr:unnamed protein product [Pseudo-nitzschia multistriata]